MLYKEAVTYIENIPKFAKKNTLDHTKVFLSALGNPQDQYKVIHVAGTNGKGSTCSYINSILLSMNKTVGLFTSPHLISMTERIRINGVDISQDSFMDVFHQVYETVKELELTGHPHPSFFEFLMLIAILSFAQEKLEYVVLETGLGGKYDNTNVIENPVATVITSIGMDHEAYLGTTIEEITYQKAGIIKKNVPLIYDDSHPQVSSILQKEATTFGCNCRRLSDSAYEIKEINRKYIAFSFIHAYDRDSPWRIKNHGRYQVRNVMLAIMTMEELFPDYRQHKEAWKHGLEKNHWPGRMEEVYPHIYVDGAHNIPAIHTLSEEIEEIDTLLFSAVEDKNYKEMIRILTTKIKIGKVIITKIPNERAVPIESLREEFQTVSQIEIVEIGKPLEAWEHLIASAHGSAPSFCLGSLYLVGEIKKYEQQKRSNHA